MAWKGAVLIDGEVHELLKLYAIALEISEEEAARALINEGAAEMRRSLRKRLKQAPSAPAKAN